MNTSNYIVSDPQIMGGAPVIKETRTPIVVILYRLKEGNSLEAIHECILGLSSKVISLCKATNKECSQKRAKENNLYHATQTKTSYLGFSYRRAS
jgi:uncharacterized protein (DUF433 family)